MNVSCNKLTSLPPLSETLKNLYCNNNKLTGLPPLPETLKILECYDNNLNSLPHLSENLKELMCSNNNLYNMPQLLEGLEIVIFYNNPICAIIGHCNYYNESYIHLHLDMTELAFIQMKHSIKILNNFHYLYYLLKYKKQFYKWLWRARKTKIIKDRIDVITYHKATANLSNIPKSYPIAIVLLHFPFLKHVLTFIS